MDLAEQNDFSIIFKPSDLTYFTADMVYGDKLFVRQVVISQCPVSVLFCLETRYFKAGI